MQRIFIACALLIFLNPCFSEEIKQRRPSLGIGVDKNQTNFDGNDGIKVVHVKPGSNAKRIGIKADDIITKIDDKEITTYDDAVKILTNLTFDQNITITLRRGENLLKLKGQIKPELGPTTIKERQEDLEKRIADLQSSEPRTERYSLKELLVILRQIEQDLPAAAKEFKETYPKGRFHISINIEIDSDTTQSQDADTTSNPTESKKTLKENP